MFLYTRSFVCELQKHNSNRLKQKNGMYYPVKWRCVWPIGIESRRLKDVIKNLFLYLGFSFLRVGSIYKQTLFSWFQNSQQTSSLPGQLPQQFQLLQEFQQKFYFHWSVLENSATPESITVTR